MKYVTLAAALALVASPALAEDVPYEVEGESFTGYFAGAENSSGLVIIVPDWDGLTDYERRRADMLAEMGYNAFALDMFGEGTPTETVEHRRAATGALYSDRERMRTLINAGVDQARTQADDDDIVLMGYCFGGAVVLEAARNDLVDGAVGFATFHGGLSTPEGQGWSSDVAPLLVLHGGADTSITLDDVATFAGELEEAGTTYTIEIYANTPHAFTVFGSDRYQERADAESWEAFSDFLQEQTGS